MPLFVPRIMRWATEEAGDEIEEAAKERVQALILDISNVMNIDTSGILALEELHKNLVSHGMEVRIWF